MLHEGSVPLFVWHTFTLDAKLNACYAVSMKSGPFLSMIADTFAVEGKTVTVYARALKEAGLLTTGARGVNAPDMTALDAARMTIALLACDGPSQAVERVQRFGQLQYSPTLRNGRTWRETIRTDEFTSMFSGAKTLEEVLSFIFSLYLDRSLDDASAWFGQHVLSLTIHPGDALAELVQWVHDDAGKLRGERVVPFKGSRHGQRGLLVARTAAPATLSMVAAALWAAGREEAH